ncbi:MAG TPA: exodeoxyribonuclease VII large subunit [Candidatus Saccharimonadales bacterium]|nr:exodeoxyribonuclease VII large subunit [Candidatus Saccharimonadales bacterium]
MRQIDGKDIFSVSEVNYFAKQTLEQMTFWVEGEISSAKKNPSWNFFYLDLKDDKALLPCISEGYKLEGLGEDLVGQKILAYGNLSLYEPFGKFQFKIAKIEKFGEGLLQKQLEELIKKLKSEGLFDAKHKKELPKYPKRICIVTSQGSDAWNDFKKHTVGQFPIIELYTADVRVQGPKSPASLLKVLPQVDTQGFDLIVITRGGGSIEDLAAFNDEQVARAIFKMETPTIVAIGHEANESLAEWVSDRRASTPTDAAHIVISGYQSLLQTLNNLKYQLESKSTYYFSTNFQRLDYIYLQLQQTKTTFKDLPHRLNGIREVLRRHEKHQIADARDKVDELIAQIQKELRQQLQNKSQNLQHVHKSLVLLSPQNTLSRGYSITTDENGKIVRSIKAVDVGSVVGIKLQDGSLKTKVTKIRE